MKKRIMRRFKLHISLKAILLVAVVCGIGLPLLAADTSARAVEAEKRGDIPLAIGQYYICLKEYDEDAPAERQVKDARMFKHAGDLCFADQRLIEALEFYAMGYKAADKGDDEEVLMGCLGNIGNIYAHFQDYNRAMSYYRRAYDAAVAAGSGSGQTKALINMSAASAIAGHIDAAMDYYRRFRMIDCSGMPDAEYHSNRLQGLMASASDNHSGAVYYYKEALRSAQENGLDMTMIANQDMQTGMEYMELEQPDSARVYIERSLKTALANDFREIAMGAYSCLAEIERQSGDTVAEQKCRAEAKRINDTLFNLRDFNNAKNALVEYEEMLQATQIETLHSRLTMLWLIIGFVAVLLTVIGVAAFIIKRRNSELVFANNTLLDKNRELIRNEEKNRELMDKYLDALHKEERKNSDAVMKKEDTDPAADRKENTDDGRIAAIGSAEAASAGDAKEAATPYLSNEQVEILLCRINRVLDDDEQIFNPEFSLNMLAQIVKSNTKYVSWVINDTYGRNFKTLLNERRIREASKRLEDYEHYGNVTIQAIAEEVGYRSSASFIQSFKKIVGMTPSVYQKLAMSKSENGGDDDADESSDMAD